MAICSLSGFESGSSLEAYALVGDANTLIQSTTVRTGTYAFKCKSVGKYIQFARHLDTTGAFDLAGPNAINDSYARFYFLYKTKPSSATGEEIFACHHTVSDAKAALRLNSAGKIDLYSAAGTTLKRSGTTVLAADTWYRIELYTSTGASSPYELKIDGVSEYSGADMNQSIYPCASWILGSFASRNANSIEFYYDDFCVSDSAFPGEGQCQVMQPDSDGSYTAWTASTGNRWDCVDEIPQSTADYVESSLTIGHANTVNLESAASAGISGTINAAMMLLSVARSTVNPGSIRQRLRSNATDTDTSTNYVTLVANTMIRRVFPTNPDGGAAWSLAALNAVQVGAVEQQASYKSRLYAAYLMVDFIPCVDASVTAVPMTATAAMFLPSVPLRAATMAATASMIIPSAIGNNPVMLTVPNRDRSFTIPPLSA
jgi:hypothetical protein